MGKLAAQRILFLLILVFASVPSLAQGSPNITSISPTSGTVGTVITIAGSNFGDRQGFGVVTVDGFPAAGDGVAPVSWSDMRILP
jgi:hypothetical protein